MESRRQFPEVVDRILYNLEMNQFKRLLKQLHKMHENSDPQKEDDCSREARSVGHDVFMLAYQIGQFHPTISKALKDPDPCISYYREHTGFPIPCCLFSSFLPVSEGSNRLLLDLLGLLKWFAIQDWSISLFLSRFFAIF